jgi:hypothetical protein
MHKYPCTCTSPAFDCVVVDPFFPFDCGAGCRSLSVAGDSSMQANEIPEAGSRNSVCPFLIQDDSEDADDEADACRDEAAEDVGEVVGSARAEARARGEIAFLTGVGWDSEEAVELDEEELVDKLDEVDAVPELARLLLRGCQLRVPTNSAGGALEVRTLEATSRPTCCDVSVSIASLCLGDGIATSVACMEHDGGSMRKE